MQTGVSIDAKKRKQEPSAIQRKKKAEDKPETLVQKTSKERRAKAKDNAETLVQKTGEERPAEDKAERANILTYGKRGKYTLARDDKLQEQIEIFPSLIVFYVDELTLNAWEDNPNWEMFRFVRKLKEADDVTVVCVAYGGLFNSHGDMYDDTRDVITTENLLLSRLQELGHFKLEEGKDGTPFVADDSLIDELIHVVEQSRSGLRGKNLQEFVQFCKDSGLKTEEQAAGRIYMGKQVQVKEEEESYVIPAINIFAKHLDLSDIDPELLKEEEEKGMDVEQDTFYIPAKMMEAFKSSWDLLRKHAAKHFPFYHSDQGKKNVNPLIEIEYDIYDDNYQEEDTFKNLSNTNAVVKLAEYVGWKHYKSKQVDIPTVASSPQDEGSSSSTPLEEFENALGNADERVKRKA